jgi:transcription antitermination factor NusG
MSSTLTDDLASYYPWYAIRTRSNYEKIAATVLEGKGYENYLPVYRCRRRWSDRVVEIDRPLFPGYVFCRFDIKKQMSIITTPGVMSVVSFGKEAAPVADSEIETVQAVLRSGLGTEPCPFLHIGERIRIQEGALEGLEGILVKKKNEWRIVVSVTMLQRSVSVEIDREWITGQK